MMDAFRNVLEVNDVVIFIRPYTWGLQSLARGEIIGFRDCYILVKGLESGYTFKCLNCQLMKEQ